MPRGRKYPQELMDRGVGLVFDWQRPVAQVAADLGMHPDALRKRVRQAEADSGKRPDLFSSEEREEIRRTNEILKSASLFFAEELDQDRTRSARKQHCHAVIAVPLTTVCCSHLPRRNRRLKGLGCGAARRPARPTVAVVGRVRLRTSQQTGCAFRPHTVREYPTQPPRAFFSSAVSDRL